MKNLVVFNEYAGAVDIDEMTIRECFIDLFDSYHVEFAEYTQFYFLAVYVKYEEDIDKIAEYIDNRNNAINQINYCLDKLRLIVGNISYKLPEPQLTTRFGSKHQQISVMIGKAYDKEFIREGMYADLSPQAQPIISDYEQFVTDHENRAKEFNAQMAAEITAKRHMVQNELDDLHKSYINVIKEIMVDVEDFLEDERQLHFLLQKFCWNFSYNCKGSDYEKFIELQAKLDDILGPEAYDVCYEIGGWSSYGTGSWLDRKGPNGLKVRQLDNGMRYIMAKKTESNINVTFLFKAL